MKIMQSNAQERYKWTWESSWQNSYILRNYKESERSNSSSNHAAKL